MTWPEPWAPADGHMSVPAGCLAAKNTRKRERTSPCSLQNRSTSNSKVQATLVVLGEEVEARADTTGYDAVPDKMSYLSTRSSRAEKTVLHPVP